MKADSVTVELRLSAKADSKVKAYADVTIPLGDDGTITALGYSILDHGDRPARVMAPARKGKQAWFDTVQLSGRIRSLVENAVLSEYERKRQRISRLPHGQRGQFRMRADQCGQRADHSLAPRRDEHVLDCPGCP